MIEKLELLKVIDLFRIIQVKIKVLRIKETISNKKRGLYELYEIVWEKTSPIFIFPKVGQTIFIDVSFSMAYIERINKLLSEVVFMFVDVQKIHEVTSVL